MTERNCFEIPENQKNVPPIGTYDIKDTLKVYRLFIIIIII